MGITPNELKNLHKRGVLHSQDGVDFDLHLSIRDYVDYLRNNRRGAEIDEEQLRQLWVSIGVLESLCGIGARAIQKASARFAIDTKAKKGLYKLWDFVKQYINEKQLGEGELSELDPGFERARVDKERADKLSLDNAKTRGELRDKESFLMVQAQIAQILISFLNALPSRLSSELSAVFSADPERVRQVLEREIDHNRVELSKSFQRYADGVEDLDES